MCIEMVTRTWKNRRYKYVECPLGLYYSLKDLPCYSEWIDVCYKWILKDMQWL